jgi:hypothetical protein
MPGPYFVQVANGQTVSSAFYIERSDRGLAIEVPSMAPNGVRVEFTSTSGTPPFGALFAPDQSGLVPFAVFSGQPPGWGMVVRPATPYARISLASAPTSTVSFTIHTLTT